MTTEARSRRRRLRVETEEATTAAPETEAPEPEVVSPTKPRGRAAAKPKAEAAPKAEPKPKAEVKPKAPAAPKAEPPVDSPVSRGVGRPTVYEIPAIEGEADDLPNATGAAKAMYRETVTAMVEKASGGSQAWLIVNPMGRKASTVQSGIKEAAKEAEISIETRLISDGESGQKVYVRVKPDA